jgi:hypothetical protein
MEPASPVHILNEHVKGTSTKNRFGIEFATEFRVVLQLNHMLMRHSEK